MPARKRFGQHFLTDREVLGRMSGAIALGTQDTVLEIGPGQGALTDELIGQLGTTGHYLAVEIDRDLVPWLQARYPHLDVVNADLLKLDLSKDVFDGKDQWRVVGNLPYNVSSAMIMQLCDFSASHQGTICDMHFMVQKEMALRLAAVPGSKSWGRLSVMAQLACTIEHLFDVAPGSFTPPPKVWSSVIRLQPATTIITPEKRLRVDRVVRVAFAQRRKRLSNALKSLNINWRASSKTCILACINSNNV